MGFENIKNYFAEYLGEAQTQGVISLIIDILFVAAVIFLFFFFIKQRMNIFRLVLIVCSGVLLFFIALFFNLILFASLLKILAIWSVGFVIILYSQELKQALDGKQAKDKGDNGFSSEKEKEETIIEICNTVDYLAQRKIGALITFERKDSLSEYIDKAIQINANITQEILTTIFTPGTACHDGAVIIRNNKIACAGSYFTLSDRYDIPKLLGTRHRAAIGMSEKNDSVTIIVSEETGNISLAVGGNINIAIDNERLRDSLRTYLLSK